MKGFYMSAPQIDPDHGTNVMGWGAFALAFSKGVFDRLNVAKRLDRMEDKVDKLIYDVADLKASNKDK